VSEPAVSLSPARAAVSSPYQGAVLGDVWSGSWAREVLLVGTAVAVLAVSAQVSIPLPFTPVPITGQTFAVLLVGASYGPLRALVSMLAYLVVGLAGAPIFSPDVHTGRARTGDQMIHSASAGYLVGMLVAMVVIGWLSRRSWDQRWRRSWVQMAVGNLVIYAFGVPWLAHQAHLDAATALAKGVLPFVVGDALKLALAAAALPVAWRIVRRR
jgi:biotin transport system substrate-specific component